MLPRAADNLLFSRCYLAVFRSGPWDINRSKINGLSTRMRRNSARKAPRRTGQPPSPASSVLRSSYSSAVLMSRALQCRVLLACCQGADLCNVVPVMPPGHAAISAAPGHPRLRSPLTRHASGPVNEPCEPSDVQIISGRGMFLRPGGAAKPASCALR